MRLRSHTRAAAERRQDQALPQAVLQHIFCLASTWQIPGSCLAAPVCRTWQSAAAGCRGIRLLYHAGHGPADQPLAAWLEQNSVQLEALTVSSGYEESYNVLEALAAAAAAAQAAGQPLRLHTLRVLGDSVDPELVGRLVAALPHLCCLQLEVDAPSFGGRFDHSDRFKEDLSPLQQATQLQQLYLEGPDDPWTRPERSMSVCMAGLLPVSLKRFSWKVSGQWLPPNLSHLTQVSFLQLADWPYDILESEVLPPSLQDLQLVDMEHEVPEEQQQVVTRWPPPELGSSNTQQQLPNLTAADVDLFDLKTPAARAAMAQLTKVSALRVHSNSDSLSPYVQPALSVAGGLHALRRLRLDLNLTLPVVNGVSALTGVTQLVLSVPGGDGLSPASSALAAGVSTLGGLKWLSVPDVLLRAAVGGLGGLQQLRVLVLQCQGEAAAEGEGPYADTVPWLAAGLQAAPSSLQVVCWSGVPAKQAAAWQLRRHLQQALGNSGCEVVVGVDLDEAADPTQQLAGLPVSLQQALV